MQLKAITKCWDHIQGVTAEPGTIFTLPETEARSLVAIGAAQILEQEPEPEPELKTESPAIAPIDPVGVESIPEPASETGLDSPEKPTKVQKSS